MHVVSASSTARLSNISTAVVYVAEQECALKIQLPAVTPRELATILAALRLYAKNPVRTEHFDGLGSTPTSEAVHRLADRLNAES